MGPPPQVGDHGYAFGDFATAYTAANPASARQLNGRAVARLDGPTLYRAAREIACERRRSVRAPAPGQAAAASGGSRADPQRWRS